MSCKISLCIVSSSLTMAAMIYLAGCNNQNPIASSDPSEQKPEQGRPSSAQNEEKKNQEHAHKQGAHDGIIIEIGRDNYHAEAVFEKGGIVKLFTLG